mmetsp:Transcript_40695/g.90475  ORF Transcript_40695/g.90475 Transcript_40695/m.90475 type:complete len:173 (-) Transcript_40695:68-586(-)
MPPQKPAYELQLVDDCIAVLRFPSMDVMNELLDSISNRVDGPIKNRQGHNFPKSEMSREELDRVLPKNLQKTCRYVIACVKGNAQTLKHELCHARYFTNPSYKDSVDSVWSSTLTDKQRSHIAAFLTRLGYKPDVHIDEFQAYALTEPPNFFGMDISDALDEMRPLQQLPSA